MLENPIPITRKLAEHDRQLWAMQDSIASFKDELLTVLDAQTVILKRLDQELAFTQETVKHIQKHLKV